MAKSMTKQEQKMWRDQAREVVRKAKARVGDKGWEFIGEAVQDGIVASETISVIQGWATMAIHREGDGGTERHMAECIIALRRAVMDEMDAERGYDD